MKRRIFALILTAIMLMLALSSFVGCGGEKGEEKTDKEKYEEALDLLEAGKHEKAYKLFSELGDYKDSAEYLAGFCFFPSGSKYEETDDTDEYFVLTDIGGNGLPSRIIYRDVEDGEVDEYYSELYYDANGNITQEIFVDSDGSVSDYSYYYNEYGQLLSKHWELSDGRIFDYEYTYNSNGDNVRFYYTSSYGVYELIESEYDSQGRLVKETHTDNYYSTVTEYTYGANGKVSLEVATRSDGYNDSIERTEYDYDADGNLILTIRDSDFGLERTEYRYENGKMIQEVYMNNSGFSWNIEYTYDKNGNLIKENYLDSNEISEIIKYSYDKNGNLIKVVDDDEISSFEYKVVYFPNGIPDITLEFLFDEIIDY